MQKEEESKQKHVPTNLGNKYWFEVLFRSRSNFTLKITHRAAADRWSMAGDNLRRCVGASIFVLSLVTYQFQHVCAASRNYFQTQVSTSQTTDAGEVAMETPQLGKATALPSVVRNNKRKHGCRWRGIKQKWSRETRDNFFFESWHELRRRLKILVFKTWTLNSNILFLKY